VPIGRLFLLKNSSIPVKGLASPPHYRRRFAGAKKWVMAFFFANSGSRTMAREKPCVVRQGQKPLSNGIV